MFRTAPALLLVFVAGGCSWAWDDLEVDADSGPGRMDAGPGRDGGPGGDDAGPGPDDAGPDVDAGDMMCGDFDRECNATEICARASTMPGCCNDPGCVDFSDRPVAWAIRASGGSTEGLPDEAYWGDGMAPRHPLTSIGAATIPSVDDGNAWFQVAWDNARLLLRIHAEDDVHQSSGTTPRPFDEIDAVQIYVDVDPSRSAATRENRIQIEATTGRGQINELDNDWGTIVASRLGADGADFEMEIEIFWSSIGESVLEGNVIALDVMFLDADAPAPAVSETWRWSRCDGAQPDVSGLVVLAGATAPPLPTCAQTCPSPSDLCAPTAFECQRGTPQLCN